MFLLLALLGCTWVSDKPATDDGADTSFVVIDEDGDGFGVGVDCDDDDALVSPDASEVCDGIDNDCDGSTDEAGAGGEASWFADADFDGFGAPSGLTLTACADPSDAEWNYASNADDCDDTRSDVNPDASEVCGGVDENCNGVVDERGAVDEFASYADLDSDGFGDPATEWTACVAPAGYITVGGDCDDDDSYTYPGATEMCDGHPNDCTAGEGWTEDQKVSFVDTFGVWTDVSEGFNGTSAAEYDLDSGTYLVCPGTYLVRLVADGDEVAVEGTGGADATFLQGGAGGTVVSVSNGNVTLSGLTIERGSSSSGGGVYLTSWVVGTGSPTLTIADSVIQDNTAVRGGGVYVTGTASLLVSNSSISDNAASDGGGIYRVFSGIAGDVSLENTLVYQNTAVDGGGIFVLSGSMTLTDSEVYSNAAASGLGGGVLLDGASSNVTLNCPTTGGVHSNQATDGGGVFLDDDATLTVTTCDFGSGGDPRVSTGTDNTPDDVSYSTSTRSYYDYGAGASFRCSGGACSE